MKYERPEMSTARVAQRAIQDPLTKPGKNMVDSSFPSEYIGTTNAYAADE